MTSPVYALPLYPVFHDLKGMPLEAGFIWIGATGNNAQANPLQVYWDEARTIPALQPIRTIAGYPARNGSPGAIYVNNDYSITVRDKDGVLVYSALRGVNFSDAASALAMAWAQSPTPPDPTDPTSKSSKSWAEIALGAMLQGSRTFEFIATAGQTVFSGADRYGSTLTIGGQLVLFQEGTALAPSDYTVAVNGLTLTLSYPANLGDSVWLTTSPVITGVSARNIAYDGATVADALDRASYAELASPYAVKPLGWRWPIQAFLGAKAEVAKVLGVQDWTPILDRALKSGEQINISKGPWNLRTKLNAATGISILDDTPIDVQMAGGAEIVLNAEIPWFSGGFFDIRTVGSAGVSSKVPLRWIGGKFNTEALVVDPMLASGISLFDIFQRSNYRLQDIVFAAGINKNGGLWGNIDTFVTTHNCFGGMIDNCDFVGAYDSGVYMSGNYYPDGGPSWDGIGEDEQISNSRFRRTNNMVTFKRDHMGAKLLNNYGYEVQNGYLASPASGRLGNQGEAIQIQGGRIIRAQGRPVFMSTGITCHISNMMIEDFGHSILDPLILTNVATGNNIAGIDIRGVKSAIVHDNLIRQREWAGGTAVAGQAILGIRTGMSDGEDQYSSDCLIHDNRIERLMRPIYDDAGCLRNRYVDNIEVDPPSGTTLQSAVLGTGSLLLKPVLQFTQAIDPASIAANASLVLTITATGVIPGDWIESWSLGNRSSSTSGLSSIGISVYAVTDGVEFVLKNNSASAVDIPNTNFSARVRKQ